MKRLLLLSLILILGCDRPPEQDATGSNRIDFEPNVHSKTFGNYTVYINAMTSDNLLQEVARSYGLSRSKNKAIINIAVREHHGDVGKPVVAQIGITTKNLNNQLKGVSLQEIRDSETTASAIYYIGEVAVDHEETLIFDLDVTPDGLDYPLLMSYRKQFFTK